MRNVENTHMEELLRAALRESTGDPVADEYSRRSILGSLDPHNEQLRQVWFQEAGPEQVAVDLHIQGEGVTGHATNAHAFSTFITRVSDAVKETAKDLAGRKRYGAELLIEAVRPGSVAVTLRAPEPKRTQKETLTPDTASVDSQALRRVAQVMTLASEEDELESDALLAAVEQLPVKAKASLRAAVREARKASWDIVGTIAERHKGISDVKLSAHGADRLSLALEVGQVEQRREESIGVIDGLKYSLGVMWFQPETGGRSFAASVKDDKTLSKVAEIAAGQRRARAEFDTFHTFSAGAIAPTKVSRVLRSIRELPAPEETLSEA